MQENVCGGDLVIATAAIRNEGTSKEYVPIEFPAVANQQILEVLKESADKNNYRTHVGIVHCKDSFYGQHSPETMPVAGELEQKWNAWFKCGTLASEMESAALFTVASTRGVRAATVLLVAGNQIRRSKGLTDNETYDTESAAKTAVDAIKILISKEKLRPIVEDNCYNYRQHTREYYNAVTGWYQRNYGLTVKKEWLTDVPSTIGAVRIALGILTKQGDAVIVQTPVFEPVVRAVEGSGCRLIDNPHNPMGKVFSREEMERLVEICNENHMRIISDEVHSLVLYEGRKHIPILAVNDIAQEIRETWEKQIAAHSFGYAVNSFAIAAVTSIMKGEADEWMEELTQYLYNNMREMMQFIEEQQLPLIPYKPEGSFLMWIDCREAGIGKEHLDKYFLEQAHIHLDDGKDGEGIIWIFGTYYITGRIDFSWGRYGHSYCGGSFPSCRLYGGSMDVIGMYSVTVILWNEN